MIDTSSAVSWPATAFSVLAVALVVGAPGIGVGVAEAFGGGDRVEFTVTVDTDERTEDPDVAARKTGQVAAEVVDRIEQRLDAIDVKHHEIEAEGADLRVVVFGDYDPRVIRAVVIPDGRLEIRPVMVDASPWLDVAQDLPAGVELYNEPGAIDPNSFFLFSLTPRQLHRAIDLVSPDDQVIEVYPHEDGWRTLRLGPALATHEDVRDVGMDRNPAGAPFVRASLEAEAAQQIRSGAQYRGARQLAMVLDGEVVALETFSERSFSESLTIQPPEHFDSTTAERQWARQVAGRLAVPIPVRLAELQE